ncbi:hypothetical protein QP166_11820 [Sphingomonas sp. LR60]|uniref:hypothetical protein n=1 Tax=Sphingomonas sp. LR60 TaxID=3050233 RepID=UPI002FDF3648
MMRIEGIAPARSLAFGEWILTQKDRGGLIGTLAAGAVADRAFPKQGNPEDVRARLRALQADGDMFEAVDDAELDWAAY